MISPSEVVEAAQDGQEYAHSPYSEYAVGAAIATDEGIFTGANIENVNYSNTLHAEEVALSRAHLNNASEYYAIAVVTPAEDGTPPCGRCRQTLSELCPNDLPVYVLEDGDIVTWKLEELLPEAMESESVLEQRDT